MVALALLGALFGLTIPIASGILVDQIIPAADRRRLGVICLFLLVLTGSASIFQAMQWLMVALGFVGAALWRLRPRPEHATAGSVEDAAPTWSWVHTEDYDDPAQPETMAAPDPETVIPES